MLITTNRTTQQLQQYYIIIDNWKELSCFLNKNPEMKKIDNFINAGCFQLKIKLKKA